jgi:hypothetical protein
MFRNFTPGAPPPELDHDYSPLPDPDPMPWVEALMTSILALLGGGEVKNFDATKDQRLDDDQVKENASFVASIYQCPCEVTTPDGHHLDIREAFGDVGELCKTLKATLSTGSTYTISIKM